MADKIDINKLKDEIDSRKKQRDTQSTNLGENVNTGNGQGSMARDSFLNDLLTSLNSGTETTATNKLKMVENAVDSKEGKTPRYGVNENVQQQPTQQPVQPSYNENYAGMDRDELMYKQFESKTKQTLGETLAQYGNKPNPNPQANTMGYPQSQPQQPMQMNEQYLSEVVQKTLENNFEAIVETAMKNVVFEIFASEKLKEGLSENRDTIKKIVYETIRELQNKKKK
ncbi:MAG: hypothetical protein ACOC2U_04250 [bacterium]